MYEGMSTFYEPLKRNKLPLFSRKSALDVSSSKSKLQSIKDDCQLFSRLFISYQSRQCDLKEFLMHENQTTPPSLSKYWKKILSDDSFRDWYKSARCWNENWCLYYRWRYLDKWEVTSNFKSFRWLCKRCNYSNTPVWLSYSPTFWCQS